MATFTLNGEVRTVDADPDTPALWVIREQLDLTGTKFGCGMAQCGACTIHVNGRAQRSCITPVASLEGASVTTIEGLKNADGSLHALQQAWIDQQAPQCGYCQSGQLMSAAALLAENPNPSDSDIDKAMKGNVCRCGMYGRIRSAIKQVAGASFYDAMEGSQNGVSGLDAVFYLQVFLAVQGWSLVSLCVRVIRLRQQAIWSLAKEKNLLHIYLKIDEQNRATAILPHSEMGQGAQTALTQMLAEELDADWDLMRFEEAPADAEYANMAVGRGYLFKGVDFPDAVVPTVDGLMLNLADAMGMQVTGGSMSIRTTGQYFLRAAGASVREMLVNTAAKSWGVPAGEIRTAKSMLHHDGTGRSAPYSEFAAAAAEMTPSSTPKLKKTSEFSVMGQSKPRHDIPSKVDGTAMFAMDVKRPGMVYAAVKRTPVAGGSLRRVDDSAARAMKGVIDVVKMGPSSAAGLVGSYSAGDTIAVVADSYWKAEKALAALDLEWNTNGKEQVSSASIFEQFDRDITAGVDRANDVAVGDANAAFDGAATVLTADYRVPYLAHTCMEPPNATAEVTADRAEIWVGCQNPLGFRQHLAASLGLDLEQVTLHNYFMGGGFGRKSNADYALQAAMIARQVGRPVQMVYSRGEDIKQDFYRPAVQSRFKAGLDADGNLVAWQNTYVDKHEPVEAPLIPYAVASQDIGHVASPTHVPFGAWRSVDHSQHGFFTESFVDEAAHAAGRDPYEFRAEMLKDKPRMLAVLNRVAKEAGWGRPMEEGRGRGISLQESFGSIVGQVVEVTVSGGKTWVDRVVAVIDAGYAVSPDGMKAQVESGVIYGLSAAMYGEITIEKGAVAQSSFADYDAIRMHDAPVIETHIINSGAEMGGAGEPGTPGVAPALANAIFDATGKRVRTLPVIKADLRSDAEASPSVAAVGA